MKNIIELLHNKNEHLEKFHNLNENELLNFAEGNFENLEVFYRSREVLLDIIHHIDAEIAKSNDETDKSVKISDQDKAQVLTALREKNELVTEILSQDLQILSSIENEKSRIIKELSQVRVTRKAVRGYRTKTSSGRLDEEA